MIAMRCPIVIASTWSCVTYTTVASSRRWSSTSSARVWTRSLASRFDNGSSMRNASGRRTMARAKRDPLALPTRELCRLPVEQLVETERLRRLEDQTLAFVCRDLAGPERELDVLAHRHVRVERVALEDHGDVAVLRFHVVDDAVPDPDRALRRNLEPGDHAERRGLAAPRRTEEHEELPVEDLEREVVDRDHIAESLRDVLQHHPGHTRAERRRIGVRAGPPCAASCGGTSPGDPSGGVPRSRPPSVRAAPPPSSATASGHPHAARARSILSASGSGPAGTATSSRSPSGVGFSSRPRSVTKARTDSAGRRDVAALVGSPLFRERRDDHHFRGDAGHVVAPARTDEERTVGDQGGVHIAVPVHLRAAETADGHGARTADDRLEHHRRVAEHRRGREVAVVEHERIREGGLVAPEPDLRGELHVAPLRAGEGDAEPRSEVRHTGAREHRVRVERRDPVSEVTRAEGRGDLPGVHWRVEVRWVSLLVDLPRVGARLGTERGHPLGSESIEVVGLRLRFEHPVPDPFVVVGTARRGAGLDPEVVVLAVSARPAARPGRAHRDARPSASRTQPGPGAPGSARDPSTR